MSSWHAPQKISSISHAETKELMASEVLIEEKVDGSFFAAGLYPIMEPEGAFLKEVPGIWELKVRSKGAVMVTEAPEGMFKGAVKAFRDRQSILHPGWMYRGECLCKPKHNALHYDRVPKDNVILFDILTEEETYLPYEEMVAEAERVGLEVVPQLYRGYIKTLDSLRQLLDTPSILGGQKIEGVVIKPIQPIYGRDGKLVMAKLVSEQFKEVHSKAWKESNPTSGDIIDQLVEEYTSQARWQKAVLHLKEAGQLEMSPRDIPKLINEVQKDIGVEEKEEIQRKLWRWAQKDIMRGVVKGLAYWYKDYLLREAMETESLNGVVDEPQAVAD